MIRMLKALRQAGWICLWIGAAVALLAELLERMVPAKDLYLIPISDLDRFVVACVICAGVLYFPTEMILIFRDMWREHHLRT